MKGYTIQHSINLLEKAVENGGGASTAADVSYDNTSSHLTADDVQEAIDELNTAIGSVTAAGVSFTNTSTGLVATNVQNAITEVKGLCELNISSTERVIGVAPDGSTLYSIYIDSLSQELSTSTWTTITGLTVPNALDLYDAKFYGEYTEQYLIGCTKVHLNSSDGTVEVRCPEASTTVTAAYLVYTKKPAEQTTRKKSSK